VDVIPALRRLRREYHLTILGKIARPISNKQTTRTKTLQVKDLNLLK
jgi:hypothetical protein